MKVFIVGGYSGSYSDYVWWPVKIVRTEEKAKELEILLKEEWNRENAETIGYYDEVFFNYTECDMDDN